jgi:predicted ATPase
MIKSIQLKCFKGFEDTQLIDLKPLTILSGINSSGKSTIIQSILMLKQTFEGESLSRTLILNGYYFHLGSFEDIVYKKDPQNIVQIKFELNPFKIRPAKINMKRITSFINFGDSEIKTYPEIERLLEIEIGLKLAERGKKTPTIENYAIKAKSRIGVSSNEFYEGTSILFERIEKELYNIHWKNANTLFFEDQRITIPSSIEKYFCSICKCEHDSDSEKGKEHYLNYYFLKGNFQRKVSFFNLVPQLSREPNEDENEPIYHLIRPIRTIRDILQMVFESIHYLGPLREEPSRRYIYEEEYVDIGNRGENAPFILALEGENRISPYHFFNLIAEKWEKVEGDSLRAAINKWLNYMEISNEYSLTSQEEILRLFLPTNMDKEVKVTLADVGFGVSQILPILVEGLRIKPNQTLILEQPEIHLHPKLQMRLADFFISMILSGRRILLETHSDHIINRIVRRIIENEENEIVSKTNILFFELVDKGSKIRQVKIDGNCGIVNWPKGFFDQSAEEKKAIILKGIERRNKLNQG